MTVSIQSNLLSKNDLLVSIAFGVLYFCVNYLFLANFDLHEDAYILLIYIRNFVETGIISYNWGGPPTEGATDFLWLLLVSFLTTTGIDPAVSMALINSLGSSVIIWIYLESLENINKILAVPILCIILISSYPSIAGLYGFSTPFFCSLFLLQIREIANHKDRGIFFIFFWGFLLALCRPEGAILGALNVLMAFILLPKNHRENYLYLGIFFFLLGILYFISRFFYFGEILPLPLMIKTSSDTLLPGYLDNRWWLKDHIFLVFACATILLADREYLKRIIILCSPAIMWLFILLFIHQSQNFSHRFQAPISALLLWIAFRELARLKALRETRRFFIDKFCVFVVTSLILTQGLFFVQNFQSVANNDSQPDYLGSFPQRLAEKVLANQKPTIAISEAGRFGYWFPGKKIDLVGLNNSEIAKEGVSFELLTLEKPDLIFIHHAWTFAEYMCPEEKPFCHIDKDLLNANFAWADTSQYVNSKIRVKQSAARTGLFLLKNSDHYHVYFAKYGDLYPHVYAIRKNGTFTKNQFETALSNSFQEINKISYLDNLQVYNNRLRQIKSE